MARKRGLRVTAALVDIPPDERRKGPLTSDDRAFWSGNDATRGGQVICSGVMAGSERGCPEIRTVNASELDTNPYGVGAHAEEEE